MDILRYPSGQLSAGVNYHSSRELYFYQLKILPLSICQWRQPGNHGHISAKALTLKNDKVITTCWAIAGMAGRKRMSKGTVSNERGRKADSNPGSSAALALVHQKLCWSPPSQPCAADPGYKLCLSIWAESALLFLPTAADCWNQEWIFWRAGWSIDIILRQNFHVHLGWTSLVSIS